MHHPLCAARQPGMPCTCDILAPPLSEERVEAIADTHAPTPEGMCQTCFVSWPCTVTLLAEGGL